MPSMKKYYEQSGKIYRFRQIVNRWKAGYRKRTGSDKYVPRPWEEDEDRLVLEHKISDRELSEKIQRSVSAIQTRRSKLKSGIV